MDLPLLLFPAVAPANACPVCDARQACRIGTRDRRGAPLASVLCQRCGHAWTDPLPSEADLERFYAQRYRAEYKRVHVPKAYHVLRAARVAAGRLQWLRSTLPAGGAHLDIGAGGGEFAALAQQAGYRVTAIEPNEGYARHAQDTYGLNILNCGMFAADLPPTSFASATLFHVLEHLIDPRAALRRVACWLHDDGLLYLEVPNLLDTAQSPRSRYHRAHLHHFSAPTLTMVLAQAGFSVARLWTSADGGVISAIARRDRAVVAPQPDAAHARTTAATLARHTPLAHALRLQWLPRLFRKQARRAEERLTAGRAGSPPALLAKGQRPLPALTRRAAWYATLGALASAAALADF